MTCAQARRLLSAYRRDDWLPAELEALGQHLSDCAECRRVEAAYRQVGEGVRQLPSITVPDSFRASVFAAIRAEEARSGRSMAQMASDETQPRMPVLRPVGRPAPSSRPRVALGARSAIAVAAVLLIGLVTARVIPAVAHNVPNLTEYIFGGVAPQTGANGAAVKHYSASPASAHVIGALASPHWLVYVTTTRDGQSMLYAEDRATKKTVPLLSAPMSGSLSLRALTDHWAIWLTGSGGKDAPWVLAASALPSSDHAAPTSAIVLASSTVEAPALLGGVWASGNIVLVAHTTQAGSAVVTRIDLSSGQSTSGAQIIAHAQTPGHLLTDPSASGDTYYWAEVWSDGSNRLRSDIWSSSAGGQAQAVTTTGDAFAPRATDQELIWVQPSAPVALDASALAVQPAQTVRMALAQLGGSIQMRDLRNGGSQQVTPHATASSLQVAGKLMVWRDGSQTHCYDLSRHAPAVVDSELRGAGFAGASVSSLVWAASGSHTINVYDVH